MVVDQPTVQPIRAQEMGGGGEPNAELEKGAGVVRCESLRQMEAFP